MIAKLAGVVDQIGPEAAVIDVGGVGYLAFCSTRTISRLPAVGSVASLLIETHVREDHIHLYGFIDAERINESRGEHSVHHFLDTACGTSQTIYANKGHLFVAAKLFGSEISSDGHGIVVTINDVDFRLRP